ncbi:hypothetical protein P167DRAFT_567399 [Morchella conica CCBAS932]|uniref:Uncharacterized protein n=1 Tax=Morchella conica CCBAS932 TaxID=1392247 RepID=A0A3N4KFM9_9PEZI|nr:hypothetical protein P167DRAFT_567399 [Morchella conica CCBAS932]
MALRQRWRVAWASEGQKRRYICASLPAFVESLPAITSLDHRPTSIANWFPQSSEAQSWIPITKTHIVALHNADHGFAKKQRGGGTDKIIADVWRMGRGRGVGESGSRGVGESGSRGLGNADIGAPELHYEVSFNPEMDIIECRVDSLKHLGCSFLFSLHQLVAYYQRTPSGNISSNMYYVGKNTFGRIEENHTLEDTETYQPTCYTKPSCD